MRQVTPPNCAPCASMWSARSKAVAQGDAPERTELLGDFHVRMAELMATRCWRRCWAI